MRLDLAGINDIMDEISDELERVSRTVFRLELVKSPSRFKRFVVRVLFGKEFIKVDLK